MFKSANIQLRPALDFVVASLVACILIRIKFYFEIQPLNIVTPKDAYTFLTFGFIRDFITYTLLGLIFFILQNALAGLLRKHQSKLAAYGVEAMLFVLFLSLLVIYFANIKLFSMLFIGINYTLIRSYLSEGYASASYLSFLTQADYIGFFALAIFYLGLRKLPVVRLKQLCGAFILFFFSLFMLGGKFLRTSYDSNRQFVLYENPVMHSIRSYITSHNLYNDFDAKVVTAQDNHINLIDPEFVAPNPRPAQALTLPNTAKGQQWNIVIFVMESVGTEFLFNQHHGQDSTPFLSKLVSKSLYLDNAYAGGNISALGQFGIFTGLYPCPDARHFELQPALYVPTLVDWLDSSYDSFLVSASNNLYFSMGINRTFKEYDNAATIEPNHGQLILKMFLNEHKAHDFFLARLSKAKPPFLGVYWSGATHFPYPNYNKPSAAPRKASKDLSRYLSNLKILDEEIKSTFALLEQNKQLKNTIFIVVGDHGEAFGQHKDTWIHGQSLYQEEVKVPVIFYQPKIFKPQKLQILTSSIDIVPTLLDIMHIPYPDQLQGESLFQKPKRRYVFMYSTHDDLAAIDHQNMKMWISFPNNTCETFDLNLDPEEQHPLPCSNETQKLAILKFRSYQPSMLLNYNEKSLAYREKKNINPLADTNRT